MKALSVIHYPVFGGPHNQAARLAGALKRHGWETLVALPQEAGNAEARLRAYGVPVVTIPLRRLRASADPRAQARFVGSVAADIATIRRLIRSSGIDLVQASGLVNPHAAVAARLERRPLVWQLLDTRASTAIRLAMTPMVAGLADVVMSTGLRVAAVHPWVPRLRERLVPYFPPVDTRSFRPDRVRRMAARDRLGISPTATVIGTLGNLNPQKGHEYLLQASARLRQAGADFHLCILGAFTPTHAAYRERLSGTLRELGLDVGGQVTMVDPDGDPALLLPAFDVFALTSVPRSEGIPTALLEAMACGLPVVATDVGGVREIVDDATGFIVPSRDVAAITAALERLLLASDLRVRLGAEARRRAERSFGVDRCAEAHALAYERALRRHRLRHKAITRRSRFDG
jgi:glycosyltransferase involved in cell wall biosynthesis